MEVEPIARPGLADPRLRLAYLNQYRERALGVLLVLGCAARLLGVPISGWVLLLMAIWLGAASLLVRFCQAALSAQRLHLLLIGYFILELALITLLAHTAGAASWLLLLFYIIAVLYAHMVLPRRWAHGITLLAAACFSAYTLAESLGWMTNGHFLTSPHAHAAVYLGLTVAAGALGGYGLVGLTLSQFSRMLCGYAEALQRANAKLGAAGQELRRHRDHLEDMVRQRTSALTQATDELRSANRELLRINELKSNFLASISHELRTPLTSIRSFSEILLDYPDEDIFTRCEFLEVIVNETKRLTRLIDDVLDLAKIEAGRLELRPRPVRLHTLVRDSLEVIQVVAGQRGLRLTNLVSDSLPLVEADPDRIRQVLMNLLSNAVKFTPSGSIEVGAETHNREVVFYVRDTGVGIPHHAKAAIFEKFHQNGDALVDKPGGTGLGLSICREIMQRHGGRIWVESEEHRGSTFYCALPLPAPLTAAIPNTTPLASANGVAMPSAGGSAPAPVRAARN